MQIEKKFYNENHQPYYICAPGYARVSNGIRAMHLLCHYLNKLGEEAYVFSPETHPALRTPYLTQDIVDRHKASKRSPIVVYPEVVHGNPLNGGAVVRYILNHPGLLGGPKDYPASDMLVFWQHDYVDFAKYPDPSYIFIPSIDTAIFNNDDNPDDGKRHRTLIYPGRYKQAQQDFPELFHDATVITYDWPESHEALAALLREGKVLYTFANSAIISEALLCGCPVVIKETQFTKKPEERAGDMKALALPGVSFVDEPDAIAAALAKTQDYQQVYHQYQLELLQQLEGFIAASQKLPQNGPNEIVFPSLRPPEAPVDPVQAAYDVWTSRHELKPFHAQIHAERMVRGWGGQPHFIILMPLSADQQPLAVKSINALTQQLYKQWQLIFVADFDAPSAAFMGSDTLGWLRIDDASDPGQLTQAYAAVLGALPCDWIGILPAGAELAGHALLSLGDYAALHPEWLAIYSDCDTLGPDGKRSRPAFKPDFNLDHLRGADYIGPAIWFKRDALQETGAFAEAPGADGYDAVWRLHDAYGAGVVGHVADVLAHLPAGAPSLDDAARGQALAAHLARQRCDAEIAPGPVAGSHRVRYPAAMDAKVSVVVVDADDGVCLAPCIAALLADGGDAVVEILAVASEEVELPAGTRLLRCDPALSLPGRYQLGAEAASGDYLLLLDSRVEIVGSDWLQTLLGLASRAGVGAVAPRLLRPDGKAIWRGPLLLGADDGAGSVFDDADASAAGHLGRQLVEHNPGAVLLDCLLLPAELYRQVGGIDAGLAGSLSAAVDLSLKIRAAGGLLVWTPFASALRHQGAGAGDADGFDDQALYPRWYGQLSHDAAHNRHLSLDSRRAFEIENVFSAEWDGSFHERSRILALPASDVGAARLRAPLTRLIDDGQCLGTLLPSGERLPGIGELERLAPDVLVQAVRFDPAFLAWQRRHRQRRPDILSVLMLDALDAGDGVSPAYMTAQLRALAREADRIVVPTEPLRELVAPFAADVRLVPDALDDARWDNLTALRRIGKKPRVGWVGSRQEAGDLLLLSGLILATAGEIEWVVLGDCPEAIQPYLEEYHPFDLDGERYPIKLASLCLDLAVMPKAVHFGNQTASPLRVFEYGAIGVPVICTALDAVRGSQAPVALVDNDMASWGQALMARAGDLDATGREGDALRAWVRENCMLSQRLPLWQEVFGR
ncbi:hypothetical protein ACPRNU_20705 [Chromobacterium vaccinii]|uniref:hypothetical protein n=1 Tax=Chromobacterium vaccinii TaxID=1108595 RepID=UPI003C71D236